MPKRLMLPATAVLLLLSACGTGKPASGLPTEPDALLKRVKVEMADQRAFAVQDCEDYAPCEPGHENFSLTYALDIMLLRVDGYEHSPYSLISGPDCFNSQDGIHWTYAYCGGSDDSLYVDPRVVLSLAVEPKVEGTDTLAGCKQVRISASLDLQRWVQQRTSHGWGSVSGSLRLAPALPAPSPQPVLPAFDREKIEMLGWEVREVYPGTEYVLAKGASAIEATGNGFSFEIYGFDEVSSELKQELGQVLAAFGIGAERIEEAKLNADRSPIFGANNIVPAEATFWLDAESTLVTKMAVRTGEYDPESGQAQPGPDQQAITLSFKYGGDGPQPPQQVINDRFAELVFDSAANGTGAIAELVTAYYDTQGTCPDAVTPDTMAAELAAKDWPRNSYQERPLQESDTFSAGDFKYERSGDNTCRLIGWGWGEDYSLEIPYRNP